METRARGRGADSARRFGDPAMPVTLHRLDCEGPDRPHPAEGWYVERFWLPVIGPAALLLARLGASQKALTVPLGELGQLLGLGQTSRVRHTIGRLIDYGGAIRRSFDRYNVRSHWATLSSARIGRLPASLVGLHNQLYPPTAPDVARSLAAEVRAVEEGHRAVLLGSVDGGRSRIKVVSDSHHGKWYEVTAIAAAADALIAFTCSPRGDAAYDDDHLETSARPGVLPCKHAGVAARRLAREGVARCCSDGLWRSELVAHRHNFAGGACACGEPADAWEGLPS